MRESVYDTMPERDAGDFLDYIDEAERLLKKHGYYDAAAAEDALRSVIALAERLASERDEARAERDATEAEYQAMAKLIEDAGHPHLRAALLAAEERRDERDRALRERDGYLCQSAMREVERDEALARVAELEEIIALALNKMLPVYESTTDERTAMLLDRMVQATWEPAAEPGVEDGA